MDLSKGKKGKKERREEKGGGKKRRVGIVEKMKESRKR